MRINRFTNIVIIASIFRMSHRLEVHPHVREVGPNFAKRKKPDANKKSNINFRISRIFVIH